MSASHITSNPKDLRPAPNPSDFYTNHEPFLSIAEAAKRSNMHEHSIYRRIRNGTLPAYGTGKAYRIRLSDLLPPVQSKR